MELRLGDDYFVFPSEVVVRQRLADEGIVGAVKSRLEPLEWIISHGQDDHAVGRTLERVLGIRENNEKKPDFFGYEIKSTVSQIDLGDGIRGKNNDICLFTTNPSGPHQAVQQLVVRYGHLEEDRYAFGTNLKVGRKTPFRDTHLTLVWNASKPRLELVSGDEGVVAWWTTEDLLKASQKVQQLMLFRAEERCAEHGRCFRYPVCTIYDGFRAGELFAGLASGLIAVHFRAKQSFDTRYRNHGVAFKIAMRDFHRLYEASILCEFAAQV